MAALSLPALRRPQLAEPAVLASQQSLAAWNYALSAADNALLEKIQLGAFQYLWREVGCPAMLVKDKTSDTVCSLAAVGFQLSALAIGVERGWITGRQGEERAVVALRSLVERHDNKKFGIYLHYVDKDTGGLPDFTKTKRRYELQASTVDHALLQAGAMTAASYFGGEAATLAERIVDEADWNAVYDHGREYLTLGWRAKTPRGVAGPGEIGPSHWEWASDEERLIYFLAAGAPRKEHALAPSAYYRLKRVVKRHEDLPPFAVSWNGSLFTYFFAHCWIDYRHLGPDHPEAFGCDGPAIDWFENSRRAVLTHRARCVEASRQFPTFSANRWGLAPCTHRDDYLVHEVRPNISDQDVWCDGALPPYGAGAAVMFTPSESMATLREYVALQDTNGRPLVWRDPDEGGYGFADSFRLDPPYGHEDHLGINLGPLLLAIENVRSGLIWRLFMQHRTAHRAIERLQLDARFGSSSEIDSTSGTLSPAA